MTNSADPDQIPLFASLAIFLWKYLIHIYPDIPKTEIWLFQYREWKGRGGEGKGDLIIQFKMG